MRKLNNVLYVTTPEAFLALDGETIVVKKDGSNALRLPLHNLQGIVCFNYPGVSPALMGACAERNVPLTFLEPSGRFLARIAGRAKGNVLLRKKQYEMAQDEAACLSIASSCVLGKIANSRVVIERSLRDHALLVDVPTLQATSRFLKATLPEIQQARSIESLRGLEGSAAKQYYRVFGQLILHQREDFFFVDRNRRPPRDNMNALLSFFYSLLTYEVVSALESVGLDPQIGFLHSDRPGRPSLALDLMEELRPMFADRLALSLVNRKQINGKGFVQKESGGVLMDDDTRKKAITAWQERKKEEIVHPYLKERMPFGLIPHVQAQLLARFMRGDLDAYPPFFWS